MKSSIFSEACSHNQHGLCYEQECQCGCHYIKRHGGLTPEEFKRKLEGAIELEGSL